MKARTATIDFEPNIDVDDLDPIDTEEPMCWALDDFSDVVQLDGSTAHHALPSYAVGDDL